MTGPAVRTTLLSLAVLFAATAPRAEAQRGWLTRRFDAFAGAAGVVGGSAVLVWKGTIAARHHFGFADLAARRTVSDRTIYHWASVTKTLTAIAVLQLRDRGLLTPRRPDHPPGARASRDPRPRRHGGQHHHPHAALPFVRPESYRALVPRRIVGAVRADDVGHIYLARVVEKLTGDPWAVYVQKNLWTPLGMDRNYVGTTPYHLAADRSHGYRVEGDSLTDLGADFDPGITIPNGGWNAPVDDVERHHTRLQYHQ